ncbi:MAG: hypothetical protein Q8N63_04180 [Nanoarchaeota archaeon]|nr:hypothetical protein [Nanoarchaeota archaeon]
MANKKKSNRNNLKGHKTFGRELEDIEVRVDKQINKEFKEVEGWMLQRKKFLIKLAWVLGFITILLVVSHVYLRTRGMG